MKTKICFWGILTVAVVLLAAGCRATVRSVSPEEDIRYSAEYSYGDLNVLSAEMATRILKSAAADQDKPQVMIIFGIDNRTDEHIDTMALDNAIRTKLIKSGKFLFVNEAQRTEIQRELLYQSQGYVSPETMIETGKQVGARYMLTGSLMSISQAELKQVRVKKKELRYYRLTLEITDLNSNLIVWTDEQEIVREEARPFIGW